MFVAIVAIRFLFFFIKKSPSLCFEAHLTSALVNLEFTAKNLKSTSQNIFKYCQSV